MPCPFLELPNELLADIINYLEDIESFRALARTCHRLQKLTEPHLYQFIFHRTGEAAANLREAIQSRPERAESIQIIESRCKWRKQDGLAYLAPVIAQSKNLRELTIESPYCNNAYGEGPKLWKQTMYSLLHPVCHYGLPKIAKLTLHLSGSERYWRIDHTVAPIFAHPTLRSLTISCAELHEDELQELKQNEKTALQRLTLIECNLTAAALAIVLSIPHALEELNIGENCYHKWLNSPQFCGDEPARKPYRNQICSSDTEAFFSALHQQRDSLKTLTYTARGPSVSQITFPEGCSGLSVFQKLKHVMLDGYCPYFEKALTVHRTAPPNLTSLDAKGDMFRLQCNPGLSLADDYQSQVSWTIAATSACPQLQNVRIVSNRTFTNVSKNHRDAVTELGEAFKDRKVSMQLLKRTYHRHIPPFLYGEIEPTEELVYDTEGGFCQELRASNDRALNDIDF